MDNEFKRKNIPALDGIRGLAILLVIASHTNAFNLSGQGGVGVWIFFVLSGFLIAQPFVYKPELANLKKFFEFYMRRLKRILPMYYVTLCLFILFLPEFIGNTMSILKHFLFIEANGHLWSTQQEMCFYIICPIVFYLNYMFVKKINLSNLIISILLLIESLLFNIFLTIEIFNLNGNGKQQVFYITVFLIGIAFSYLIESNEFKKIANNKYINYSLNCLSFCSILIFIFTSKYYKEIIGIFPTVDYLGWSYPVFFSILAGILILTIINNPCGLIAKIFNIKILRYFGKISYSMYLIHYFLLQFLNKYMTTNLLFIVLLLITYVISTVTYNLIEQKLIKRNVNIKN